MENKDSNITTSLIDTLAFAEWVDIKQNFPVFKKI